MSSVTKIKTLARQYLEHRRNLGFAMEGHYRALEDFGAYCDREAPRQPITTARAVEWENLTTAGPERRSARLALVRNFALYCAAIDPLTQVPACGLMGRSPVRTRPHIFTNRQVTLVMHRARRLSATLSPLRPFTYETLVGLLACTGMRPAEALRLKLTDFDAARGTLRVPALKSSPERELPLHPTAVAAIEQYLERRRRLCPQGDWLFTGPYGRRLSRTIFGVTMHALLKNIGSNGIRRTVRPYDLRHTFATKLIAQWSRQEAPVAHRLLLLTRYLGHAQFTNTWWYVSAEGSALRAAAKQFDQYRRSRDLEEP